MITVVTMITMMMMTMKVRNLPMGEYIVCGEAVNDVGEVLQSTCFNVIIQRIDNTGESYFRRFSSNPVIWKHVGEPFLCHVEASLI